MSEPTKHHIPDWAKDDSVLHNSDKLTPEQVGKEYRLVVDEDSCDQPHEMWTGNGWHAAHQCSETFKEYTDITYRLPRSVPWPERKVEPQPTFRPTEDVIADLQRKLQLAYRERDDETHNRQRVESESVALQSRLTAAERERDDLAQWKREALTVMSQWDEIDTFIRKHPEAPLGRNVSAIALEWLKERDSLHSELATLKSKAEPTDLWSLPEPPSGMAWHRTDGWTEEMLSGGWRPLLKGEVPNISQDEVFWPESKIWTYDTSYSQRSERHLHTRTRRPLPTQDPFEEWYAKSNPKKVARLVWEKFVKEGQA